MSSAANSAEKIDAGIPEARVRSASSSRSYHWRTRLWWLTGLCGIIAVGLAVASFRTQGEMILIHFQDGHGLKVGDTLRYRGIDVGSVTSVSVDPDMRGVAVRIQLEPSASQLAVEGSQFWIQRARLRIGQISGLDTVLGAKYVGVIPGDPHAKVIRTFVGRETPLGILDNDSIEARVRFPAGEGLEIGDSVRYRGIVVGEVTFVELTETVDSVWVGVRLVGYARTLARAGTQFWIERPRLDLTEIRGLETIVSGRYLAVQPTSQTAALQTEFLGLAEPPPLPRRDGSLEVELDAPSRLGLVRGAPITYRGLEVGRVANVGLSSDGASVQIQVIIEPEYAELVRDDSQWWVIGGVGVDLGLTGVALSIDSFAAWLRGGIAFATPDRPGRKVVTGHRFSLAENPKDEWLQWQPRIAMGPNSSARDEVRRLPKPLRVAASWQSSWFGFSRRRSVQTWALALDDGTLCVPTAFADDASAAPDNVAIEVAGKSFLLSPESISRNALVTSLVLPKEISVAVWPRARVVGEIHNGSTLLVINPELAEPMAIDSSRAKAQGSVWQISVEVPIASGLAGSSVVDSRSDHVIGMLAESDNGWVIAKID